MTLAITGATGQLGRLAIAALKARFPGLPIIALARTPDKAVDLNIEVREADYHRPETLAKALVGVTRLVLISSYDMTNRPGQHQNVINAAKAAGVGHLIYTSLLKGLDSPLLLAADHKATERAIAASGLDATILRNSWYTENYTGIPLVRALEGGTMIGCAGDGKFSTASRADLAEAIAVVASGPGHEGKTYELAGDAAYTMSDMAAEVSRITGRAIPYDDISEAAFVDLLKGTGLPDKYAAIIADVDARAAEGALFDDGGVLGRLIGRPTTPMAVTIAKALA
jgi:NAD(P)H dehydrogenase (quinone)